MWLFGFKHSRHVLTTWSQIITLLKLKQIHCNMHKLGIFTLLVTFQNVILWWTLSIIITQCTYFKLKWSRSVATCTCKSISIATTTMYKLVLRNVTLWLNHEECWFFMAIGLAHFKIASYYNSTCTIAYIRSSHMTLIGEREMHGRVHPYYCRVNIFPWPPFIIRLS